MESNVQRIDEVVSEAVLDQAYAWLYKRGRAFPPGACSYRRAAPISRATAAVKARCARCGVIATPPAACCEPMSGTLTTPSRMTSRAPNVAGEDAGGASGRIEHAGRRKTEAQLEDKALRQDWVWRGHGVNRGCYDEKAW